MSEKKSANVRNLKFIETVKIPRKETAWWRCITPLTRGINDGNPARVVSRYSCICPYEKKSCICGDVPLEFMGKDKFGKKLYTSYIRLDVTDNSSSTVSKDIKENFKKNAVQYLIEMMMYPATGNITIHEKTFNKDGTSVLFKVTYNGCLDWDGDDDANETLAFCMKSKLCCVLGMDGHYHVTVTGRMEDDNKSFFRKDIYT